MKYVGCFTAPGEDNVRWVIKQGKPRYCQKRQTISSELCIPLPTHKRLMTVTNAESDQPEQIVPRDLEVWTTFANVVAGSLERMALVRPCPPRVSQSR